MTRFWRDGFWRTSVNGHIHWVEGHWVDRDYWFKSNSCHDASYYWERLRTLDATRTYTSGFVNPNAECPVCGKSVFFYQNEYGSRVYFDELGPPWPKHPCTDNFAERQAQKPAAIQVSKPVWRSEDEVSAIASWQQGAGLDPLVEFKVRYSQSPWSRVRVIKRLKYSKGTLLAVVVEKDGVGRESFLKAKHLTRSISEGSVVFLKGKTLSFFDMASMSEAEASVERVRSLTEVVRLLME